MLPHRFDNLIYKRTNLHDDTAAPVVAVGNGIIPFQLETVFQKERAGGENGPMLFSVEHFLAFFLSLINAPISFRAYFRIGAPLTAITLAVGTLWLSYT